MTSSLTTALEEMTINNEQLRREVDLVKAENKAVKDENVQLKANNDKQKDEITQLTTVLVRWLLIMRINYVQLFYFQSSEIDKMRDENDKQKDEIEQLRAENQQLKVSQWSGSHELFTYTIPTIKFHI